MSKKIVTMLGIVFIAITISFNITYATDYLDNSEIQNFSVTDENGSEYGPTTSKCRNYNIGKF